MKRRKINEGLFWFLCVSLLYAGAVLDEHTHNHWWALASLAGVVLGMWRAWTMPMAYLEPDEEKIVEKCASYLEQQGFEFAAEKLRREFPRK
jgi:hypothetical protein